MNFRQLEAYRAIMLTGTVTQAASMLRVSQPAVSRLLAQLEDHVGFLLFKRSKGRLVPTPEGLNLYREVEKAFVGVERIKEKAHEIKDLKSGLLSLACMPAVALGVAPRVIARFVKNRPEVNVTLQVLSTQKVLEWMAVQQSDIGIAAEPTDDPAYTIEPIRLRCVCVLPPGHLLAENAVITPADLRNDSFVSLGREHMMRFRIDDAFEQAKVHRREMYESPLTAVVCSMVRYGLGVSVVDPFSACDAIAAGVIVKPFEPMIPFDLGVLYPAFRPHSKLATEFVSELRRYMLEVGIEMLPQTAA